MMTNPRAVDYRAEAHNLLAQIRAREGGQYTTTEFVAIAQVYATLAIFTELQVLNDRLANTSTNPLWVRDGQ